MNEVEGSLMNDLGKSDILRDGVLNKTRLACVSGSLESVLYDCIDLIVCLDVKRKKFNHQRSQLCLYIPCSDSRNFSSLH